MFQLEERRLPIVEHCETWTIKMSDNAEVITIKSWLYHDVQLVIMNDLSVPQIEYEFVGYNTYHTFPEKPGKFIGIIKPKQRLPLYVFMSAKHDT